VIERQPRRRRWAPYLAWTALAVTVALMVGGAVLWEVTNTSADGTLGENLLTGLAFLSFPAMGATIASRRPSNAIGWLLIGVGLVASLLIACMGYAVYGLVTNEQGAPGATLAAWFVAWLWFPLIATIPTFLPLLFPTGAVPSRRWRPVAWLNTSVVVIVTLPAMVEARLAEGNYNVPNPIGIAGLGDTEDQVFSIMGPIAPDRCAFHPGRRRCLRATARSRPESRGSSLQPKQLRRATNGGVVQPEVAQRGRDRGSDERSRRSSRRRDAPPPRLGVAQAREFAMIRATRGHTFN
jgi:hypothetical protein